MGGLSAPQQRFLPPSGWIWQCCVEAMLSALEPRVRRMELKISQCVALTCALEGG